MQEMQVWSFGQEDPLEEGMATHSSILAWKIPWTEKSGRLQFMGLQRVGYNWVTEHSTLAYISTHSRNVDTIYTMQGVNKFPALVCRDVDGPRDCHTECSEQEREQQISYNITCMWNPEKLYQWTFLQSRNRNIDVENKGMDIKGKGVGREESGGCDWRIHSTHIMYRIDNCWELYLMHLVLNGSEIQERRYM